MFKMAAIHEGTAERVIECARMMLGTAGFISDDLMCLCLPADHAVQHPLRDTVQDVLHAAEHRQRSRLEAKMAVQASFGPFSTFLSQDYAATLMELQQLATAELKKDKTAVPSNIDEGTIHKIRVCC